MKIEEIIPFLEKDVIITLKSSEKIKGFLSNTVSFAESDSGKGEVDVMCDGYETGAIIEDIKTIRVIK